MKLLKFSMTGCGPCIALAKQLESMTDHPLVATMENVNVDDNPELAIKYSLRTVPVMIIVDDNGEVIKRQNGFMTKEQILTFLS